MNFVVLLAMADLRLKRVKLRNWMQLKDVDLTIPEKGLVLVQGINTASGGALASVGSGKTSVGEAICRALFGVSGRFTSMKQYSRNKEGDCYVRIEAELLGEPLVVESGYKCQEMSPTGEALRYTYRSDKPRERGRLEQTRQDLSILLGVPELLAEWTVFVDGEKLKFNKLSQADCVDLVMSALRQPPWTKYHEQSKAKLGAFKRDMAHNASDHQEALGEVEAANRAVAHAEELLEEETQRFETRKKRHQEQVDEIHQRISKKQTAVLESKSRMKAIAKELKKLEEERAEATHALEIEIHEVDDKLLVLEDDKKAVEEVRDASWDKYTTAKSNHENYKQSAAECPTCKRPLGKIDLEWLEGLLEIREKTKGFYDKEALAVSTISESIKKLREQHRALSQKFRDVSAKKTAESISEEHAELEEYIEARLEEIKNFEVTLAGMAAGPTNESVVEMRTKLRVGQDYLKHARAKLNTMTALVAEDQTMLKILEYWNFCFGPTGAPCMILREAVPALNAESKRISLTMTGGTICVKFNTVREMASGLEKAQLNIEVDNKLGDKDLAGSSKGEAGLTNFIISEALGAVGQISRRVGFQWLDEIVPHQDMTVCKNFYSYLKQKADALSVPIFLVDHNPVAANYANEILVVEKKGHPPDVLATAGWR
jgi:DNA repair exonuclease SbcCD ATPase subunit